MSGRRNQVKHDLYMMAYSKTLESYIENPDQDEEALVKKLIVYGVKAVISRPEPKPKIWEDSEHQFNFADSIIRLMGVLTPQEFVNIFPIKKDFKGHRWEIKDYFYTRDYVRTLDPDKKLGEGTLEFMWEYMNDDINNFNVEVMGYMSDLNRMQGQPTLMDDFARIMGVKTYTMFKDDKDREFLLDKETGKTIKVRKARPRLKIV